MLTVKGHYKNGLIYPDEPVQGRPDQDVTIIFAEPSDAVEAAQLDAGWDALNKLIDDCQVDTGISDFADQHDHYIHGTPKREA